MSGDKEIRRFNEDNIIFKIGYIIMINICFLLSISPFLIYLLTLTEESSLIILLLLSILTGPALTTLFSVMGKLIREKKVEPLKDFIHFYKLNLVQGIVVAAVLNALLLIEYIDKNYCVLTGNDQASYLFLFLIIITVLISFYMYPIISRYNMGVIYSLKLSLKFIIKNIYVSLFYVLAIILTILMVNLFKATLFILFAVAGLLGYLVMLFEMNSIEELKDQIYEKYNK
ncbi:MAG: DUF624 domain-containing protein [Clostridiaceae bacterium]|nr:DUF624 domain-containing protein [Clostridiaceae bacterium]